MSRRRAMETYLTTLVCKYAIPLKGNPSKSLFYVPEVAKIYFEKWETQKPKTTQLTCRGHPRLFRLDCAFRSENCTLSVRRKEEF